MTKPNMMKYFISGEGGTSSLLATLFDPNLNQPSQAKFWRIFCERLKSDRIQLSVDGPQDVKQEYMDIDIVMIWGDWIIALENKISAASITRYQLQRYYNSIVNRISKGSFLSNKEAKSKHICVVYLTPTQGIGLIEFESLKLREGRKDTKIHLSWQAILHDIEEIFRFEPVTNPYVKLVHDGIAITRQLLKEHTKREPKIKETQKRMRMKKFVVEEVEPLIRGIMQLEPTLQLNLWRDRQLDQLYGNIDGRNTNIYLNLWEEGTSIPKKGRAHLHITFSTMVAGKAPREYKRKFNEHTASYYSAILALDSDTLILDTQKHSATVEFYWTGQLSQLAQDAAALFCRFLITFRPFMGETNISPRRQLVTNFR